MGFIDTVFRRKREIETLRCGTAEASYRAMVNIVADCERDGCEPEIAPDHILDTLERAHFTENDFRACVEERLKRDRLFPIAQELNQRQTAAEQAERDFHAADLAEGRRHREALQHLRELEEAARVASLRHQESIAAHSNLIADADTSAEERELYDRLATLNEHIQQVENGLNPNYYHVYDTTSGGHVVGAGGAWAPIDQHPALLVRQTRETMENTADSDRKKRLAEQLKGAERSVTEFEKRLVKLVKERDKLNAQLAEFNVQKLRPESFRIVRSKRSPAEQNGVAKW